MKKGRVILVIAVIVSTSLFWFSEGTVAGGNRISRHGYKRADIGGTYNHVVRVLPKPPGWPQMWLAADVIKSFNENGLIVKKTKEEKGIELSDLSAKTNEAIRFSVSFNAKKLKGCVLEFDEKKDFDKVKNHYRALNNNGELHTWSLIKDNILLVIDGSMPDQEIRKYETVLAGMK